MTRFDDGELPFWTRVGDGYLWLLDPLRIGTMCALPGREPYVKTLRQLGSRPTRDDIDAQGYALTQAMPAIGVHVESARAQGSTSLSQAWRLEVEVHCFCAVLERGAELRQDRHDGIRSVTHHVVEYLHRRIPRTPLGPLDAQGIDLGAIDHITTTPRVDWWVVRTTVDVHQEIQRQRTRQADGVEFRQFGKPKREPVATPLVLDFNTAITE